MSVSRVYQPRYHHEQIVDTHGPLVTDDSGAASQFQRLRRGPRPPIQSHRRSMAADAWGGTKTWLS